MTFDRITIDPRKMNGQPTIRGMRLTVRRVLEAVSTYPDRNDLGREYPELEDEDLRQALAYAAAMLDGSIVEAHRTPAGTAWGTLSASDDCRSGSGDSGSSPRLGV